MKHPKKETRSNRNKAYDSEVLRKYVASNHAWASRNNEAMSTWLERSIVVFEKENPDLARWFVLIHGIVADIFFHFERHVASLKKGLNVKRYSDVRDKLSSIQSPSTSSYVTLLISCFEHARNIRRLFTKEMLSEMKFYRHSYSHPVLTGYAISFRRDAGGKISFDKEKEFDEYRRVTSKHELDVYESIKEIIKSNANIFKELSEELKELHRVGKLP